MLFQSLIQACFFLTSINAQSDHLKRYSNDTSPLVSVGSSNVSALEAAVQRTRTLMTTLVSTQTVLHNPDLIPSLTTITSRTTVTAQVLSTPVTTYAMSILMDPQVAVVAAAAEPEAVEEPVTTTDESGSTIRTVYLPTTIYVTRPCDAATLTTSPSPAAQVVLTTFTTKTGSVPASASTAILVGNDGSDKVDAEAQDVQSTLRVTQTLVSTMTVHATTIVSTMKAPYSNSTSM